MKNTFERVKETLNNALNDKDNKVIALTGKWGTGKTHLWNEVRQNISSKLSPQEIPIYISIFGVRNIEELKFRILKIFLDNGDPANRVIDIGLDLFKAAVKKLTDYSLDNAALLALPQLISKRLIVIDDIERKHDSLDLNEVFGFANEYSEIYKVQILAILNNEKFDEKNSKAWKEFHEKVVDIEIQLIPTAEECFDEVFKKSDYLHLDEVRKAISNLNLNNIRVMERILKNVAKVSLTVKNNEISLTRWVPVTALLTACHYKALENAPSFEYIKSYNSYNRYFMNKAEKSDPEEIKWNILMERLGISGADNFEVIIQDYLKTGLLDKSALDLLFKQYESEMKKTAAQDKVNNFFDIFQWRSDVSDTDLLKMATKLLNVTDKINASEISRIINIVESLGDAALVRKLLDKWLSTVEGRPEYQQISRSDFREPVSNIHPEVIAKIESLKNAQNPLPTILTAVETINTERAWGNLEMDALLNSTVAEYESTLTKITGEKLHVFFDMHINWISSEAHDGYLEKATNNFIGACKNIISSNGNQRLTKIINREFQRHELTHKLNETH